MRTEFTEKLSLILDHKVERISIQQILDFFGRSAGFLCICIFCAPTALPLPAMPGFTQVFAAIVFLMFSQILIGKKKMWLPEFLSKREISKSFLDKILQKLLDFHLKFKALPTSKYAVIRLACRISAFFDKKLRFLFLFPFDKIIFVFCLFLSICVALPIPFSNTVPSIGLIFIAIGFLERKALSVLAGLLIGIGGVFIVALMYVKGVEYLKGLF